jgi:catechol 2,3-dioxygenase
MGIDPRVDIGHVHLKVADIDRSLGFYRDILGFDVMQRIGDEAAFLSAGGYHHHVGANTWRSGGAGPPEPGAAAQRRFEIVLPGEAERDRLVERLGAAGQAIEEHADGPLARDPSGNAFTLLTA